MMASFYDIFNFLDISEQIFKFCDEQDLISVRIVLGSVKGKSEEDFEWSRKEKKIG